MWKYSGFVSLCLVISSLGQEDLYQVLSLKNNNLLIYAILKKNYIPQDELSAPIVDDFLPSAPPSTSTAKPTAPSVLLPVEAVPIENLRDDEEDDVGEEVIEEVKVERFVERPSQIEEEIKVVKVERQPLVTSKEPEVQAEELLAEEAKPVVEEPKQVA